MNLSIHHIAIISSDVDRAKRFYVDALGFKVIAEQYREARDSWKIDLMTDGLVLPLVSRGPRREVCGMWHFERTI
jgi:glyoxylase I family protein